MREHMKGLEEARAMARFSPDPSTQCGAVILTPDGEKIGKGFNSFPLGCPGEHYHVREEKYPRVVHAEMAALLGAWRHVEGAIMYVWPSLPCPRCAAHIARMELSEVVAPYGVNDELFERMNGHLARQIFDECDIGTVEVNLGRK